MDGLSRSEYDPDQIATAVQELQAITNALVLLFIDKGLLGDQEFARAKIAAERHLEEHRSRASEIQQQELTEEVTRLMQKVKSLLHRLRPGARVDLVLTKFDPDPDRCGVVVRIIDSNDIEPSVLEVQEHLTSVVARDCRHEPYVNWIMPVEIMVFDIGGGATDPLSLQFSAVQRRDLLRLSQGAAHEHNGQG